LEFSKTDSDIALQIASQIQSVSQRQGSDRDLGDLIKRLGEIPELSNAAQESLTSLSKSVITRVDNQRADSSGVSAWIPGTVWEWRHRISSDNTTSWLGLPEGTALLNALLLGSAPQINVDSTASVPR
jgi:hypothetical protein